jgi:hypothetical protein
MSRPKKLLKINDMRIFQFLILITVLAACKKHDLGGMVDPPPPPPLDSSVCALGLIQYLHNGDTIKYQSPDFLYGFSTFIGDTVFQFETYRVLVPLVDEKMLVYHVLFQNGFYQMFRPSITVPRAMLFAVITVDGDQGVGTYYPDSTAVNQLEVIKIDREKQTMQGRFKATLISENPPQFTFLTDTMHITDGVFHVKCKQW